MAINTDRTGNLMNPCLDGLSALARSRKNAVNQEKPAFGVIGVPNWQRNSILAGTNLLCAY